MGINSFTLDDLQNNRVVYVHDGSETASDSFNFTITDGTDTTGVATFSITVDPVSDAPIVSTNTGLTVAEGGSQALTAADLSATDVDNIAAELTFTVTSAPTNGQIELTGNPGVSVNSFTLEDIQNGLVVFVHDGSEGAADSFDFTVDDGTNTLPAATFNITVTPVNDAPVVSTNTGLTANEGATTTITAAVLNVTDPDNAATDLIYTVTSAVTNGQLELTTNPGVAINSFTLDDIQNNRVVYVHDGSETTVDSFDFEVTDGTDITATDTFAITVTPVSDAPTLDTNTGVDIFDGFSTVLNSSMLSASDVDNTADEITYTITTAAVQGTVKLGGVALGLNDTFTQDDIDNGLVTYEHSGSGIGDSFGFSIDDGTTPLAGNSFTITVDAVNDTPIILANTTIVASENFEGGATGWSNNTTTAGGQYFTEFLGRFVNDVASSTDQDISKTFTLSGAQDFVEISFDFYELDAWESENFLIFIDDAMAATIGPFSTADDVIPSGSNGNISWTVDKISDPNTNIGFAGNQDQMFRINLSIDTQGADIKLGFGSDLNNTGNANSEAYGIDNLEIREVKGAGAPVFDVSELVTNGDVVGTVHAIDADIGQSLTYTITAGGTGDGIFGIDATTGKISVLDDSAIDYESGTTSYTLTIRATDNAGTPDFVEQTVTINLLDAEENTAPSWGVNGPYSTVETAGDGTSIAMVTATDAESNTLTYSIVGGNVQSAFAIDANTGEITINDSSVINFEELSSYTLTVRATDDGMGTLFSNTTITIDITNFDELPSLDPVQAVLNLDPSLRYDASTGNFYKFVNANVDFATAQANAAATTLNGVGGHLVTISSAAENTFVDSIISDNVWMGASDSAVEGEWIWVEGPEAGEQFWLGDANGSAVNGAYTNWNTSEPGVEDGIIMSTNTRWYDAALTSGQSYVIEWEAADVINNSEYIVSHDNPDASDITNGTSVGFVMGSDPEGDTLTYSIQGGNTGGVFAIDPVTGEITIANDAALDATVKDTYTLTIRVTEDNGSNQIDEIDVTVRFNDTPGSVTNTGVTITEGNSVTLTTAELNINDSDDAATNVIFAITSGVTNGTLELSSAPGTPITSFTLADLQNGLVIYDHNGSDTLSDSFTFTVTDGDTTLPADTFDITVTPVNDAPIITTLGGYTGIGNDADPSGIDAIGGGVLHFDALDIDADGDTGDQPEALTPDNPESILGTPLTTGSGTQPFNSTPTQFPQSANSFFAIDLTIPANPSGSLFEAGGGGTGIYVGFDNNDNFVLRAGDGAAPPGGNDAGLTTAAILRTSEAPLVGKTGTIFCELNVDNGTVTAWFLEGGVGGGGTPELLGTAAAPSGAFESNRIHGGGSGGLGGTNSGVGGENNTNYNETITGFRFYTNELSPVGAGGNPTLPGDVWIDGAGGGLEINNATGAGVTYNVDGFGTDLGGVDFSGTTQGLSIAQSTDYNDSTSGDRSFAVTFRTGTSVAGDQIIFEQGGGTNGYNFTIVDGNLYAYAYMNAGVDASVIDLGAVEANSIYTLTAIHDVGPNTFEATLNGGTAVAGANIAEVVHGDEGGIGNDVNGTRDPTNPTASLTNAPFTGLVGEIRTWNTALDANEVTTVQDYLMAKWGRDNPDATLEIDIAENLGNGTLVIDADATDSENDTVTWSIESGNLDGIFAIDVTTGEITIIDSTNLDFDTGNTSYDLVIRATDDGTPGAEFTEQTIHINLTDINEAPTIDTNTGVTMDEGATITVTNAMLAGSDQDAGDDAANITYTASNLSNGVIEVNGVAQNTFTQADINNGMVEFIHDGSETITAGFDISLADGGEDTAIAATGSFAITVTPVNDAPVIVNNTTDTTVINFNDYTVSGVGGQDAQGGQPSSYQILDGGNTLLVEGNAWKRINLPVNITAGTTIEFDFRSTNEGEIHGLTFSADTSYQAADLNIELFGTDPNAGFNQAFNSYQTADGWTHYSINVGAIGTGAFNHMFFLSDDDAAGNSNSFFRNVVISTTDTPNMNEGSDLVITSAMLNESDPDDSGAGLTYTATNLQNGHIEVNGATQNTFTQDDIDNGVVKFVHDGSETLKAGFDIELADSGADGAGTDTGTFYINVVPGDDAPVQTVNAGTTLNEGATHTLTTAMLNATDADTDAAILTYTVTNAPDTGQLELTTNPGIAINSFTLADIQNSRVVYVHDGGETTTDSFDFTLTDGSTTLVADTFNLTITPVNDGPQVTNKALTVAPGVTKTILTSEFTIADPDNSDDEITITITGAPSDGQFELKTNPGVAINSFTYEDIANGDVVYVHDGSFNATDSFDYTVSDGAITTAADTFTINVNFANTDPTVNSQTFGVAENSANGTVVGNVVATDLEDAPANLKFFITDGNDDGAFAISSTGQIIVADGTKLDRESLATHVFTVRVEDTLGGATTAEMTVNLSNVNEAPTNVVLSKNNFIENTAIGAEIASLSAVDVDGPAHTYTVLAGLDSDYFNVIGDKLVVLKATDYESGKTSFNLTIRVNDGEFSFDQLVNILLTDFNENTDSDDNYIEADNIGTKRFSDTTYIEDDFNQRKYGQDYRGLYGAELLRFAATDFNIFYGKSGLGRIVHDNVTLEIQNMDAERLNDTEIRGISGNNASIGSSGDITENEGLQRSEADIPADMVYMRESELFAAMFEKTNGIDGKEATIQGIQNLNFAYARNVSEQFDDAAFYYEEREKELLKALTE